MPLPVLKVTVGTPFFRHYGRDFMRTFDTLYTYFKQGQETGNLSLCVSKINEVFEDDHEKFQIFACHLSTFLTKKISNVEIFTGKTLARVQYEQELVAARKKLSKVQKTLAQEQLKLGKIELNGIGWYGKWKHKRLSATVAKLEQMESSTTESIRDIIDIKSFACTKSISADFATQKKEIETSRNYINFLNLLSSTADQKLSDYNISVENSENTPEIDENKSMLLQSCVCIQTATKIAVQNFTESAQQFNESVDLFKAKKQFFIADADYHISDKINYKVAHSNSSEKEKREAAVVVQESKCTKILVVIGSAIKQVIKKMKETPHNPTVNLTHHTHAEGGLSANAMALTDYMGGVKYQPPIIPVKKQVDVDLTDS